MKTCNSCRFARWTAHELICRRYPEQMLTREDYWCGEYDSIDDTKPREDPTPRIIDELNAMLYAVITDTGPFVITGQQMHAPNRKVMIRRHETRDAYTLYIDDELP